MRFEIRDMALFVVPYHTFCVHFTVASKYTRFCRLMCCKSVLYMPYVVKPFQIMDNVGVFGFPNLSFSFDFASSLPNRFLFQSHRFLYAPIHYPWNYCSYWELGVQWSRYRECIFGCLSQQSGCFVSCCHSSSFSSFWGRFLMSSFCTEMFLLPFLCLAFRPSSNFSVMFACFDNIHDIVVIYRLLLAFNYDRVLISYVFSYIFRQCITSSYSLFFFPSQFWHCFRVFASFGLSFFLSEWADYHRWY